MATTKTISYKSPGLTDLLTVLFVGLKLGGVISWSWWWVLAPTLIPVGLITAFLLLVLLVKMLP